MRGADLLGTFCGIRKHVQVFKKKKQQHDSALQNKQTCFLTAGFLSSLLIFLVI
jgi:hypothetical protein